MFALILSSSVSENERNLFAKRFALVEALGERGDVPSPAITFSRRESVGIAAGHAMKEEEEEEEKKKKKKLRVGKWSRDVISRKRRREGEEGEENLRCSECVMRAARKCGCMRMRISPAIARKRDGTSIAKEGKIARYFSTVSRVLRPHLFCDRHTHTHTYMRLQKDRSKQMDARVCVTRVPATPRCDVTRVYFANIRSTIKPQCIPLLFLPFRIPVLANPRTERRNDFIPTVCAYIACTFFFILQMPNRNAESPRLCRF